MMLVTGATGTVGRLVIDQLVAARGKVRAISRTPGTAGLPGEVEVVGPGTLRSPAVDGPLADVRAVFVNPAAVSENIDEFVALARRAGVRRLRPALGRPDQPRRRGLRSVRGGEGNAGGPA